VLVSGVEEKGTTLPRQSRTYLRGTTQKEGTSTYISSRLLRTFLPSPTNLGVSDTVFQRLSFLAQSGDGADTATRSCYGKPGACVQYVLMLRTTDYDGDGRQCRDPPEVEAQQIETSRRRRDRRIGS